MRCCGWSRAFTWRRDRMLFVACFDVLYYSWNENYAFDFYEIQWYEIHWKVRSTIRYLGVKGWIGVVGSRRILGLDGRDSIVSSISNASVSIEERCWCWRSRRCLLLEDGVKRANESACRTVACDSFQIPSLWSLVTSFVNESLDANGDVIIPVILVPGPKSSGQSPLCRSGRVGDT